MKIKNLSIILVIVIILSMVPLAASAAWAPYDMISAVNYTSTNNAAKNKPNGNKLPISNNIADWICFADVTFEEKPYAVVVSNATDVGYLANNTIVFRLDSPTGKIISTVYITESQGWSTPVNIVGTITEEITGTHDIYVSSSRDNDLYSFYFKANLKGELNYVPYDDTKAFSDMEGNPYQDEAEILNGLGIVSSAEPGIFNPDLPMTRGSFASWVAHFMTEEVPEAKKCEYTDVATDYQYYNEICYLYDHGLLKLNSDKTFNPWDFITVREASAIMLRLMGYEKMAEYKDGWPAGYDNVARSVGLIKGMVPTDYLRRGPAAGMLYNAIDAEYLTPVSITNGSVTYGEKTGILEDLRDLYKAIGVVQATSYGGIIGDVVVPDGYCYIGNELYETDGITVEYYLGVECEYYYTTSNNTDTKTLIYITPTPKTQLLTLNSKEYDFVEISSKAISYRDKNNKKKVFNISSKAVWVYNNKAIDVPIESITDEKTFSGSVRLVNGRDGCNAVFVEEYINIKLQSYNNDTKELVDSISGNKWIFTDKNVIFSNGEVSIRHSDLKRGMLAELYLSHDGKMAVIIFDEQKITASASEIKSDGVVVIGSKEYYVAKECKDKIILGVTTDFYLNRHGEIVYTKINDNTKAVGILYDLAEKEDKTVISLITGTNIKKDFNVASKIIVDGVRMTDYEEISAQITVAQRYKPVLYRTNAENEITMIDTLTDAAKNEHDTFNAIEDYNTSITYAHRAGLKALVTGGLPKYPITDNTIVVLKNANSNNDTDFHFGKRNMINYAASSYGLYSFTRNNQVPDLVYCENYSLYQDTDGCVVFKGMNSAINKDGDIGYNLTFVNSGGERTFWIAENHSSLTLIKTLVPGDVVNVITDINGAVFTIEVKAFASQEPVNSAGVSAAFSNIAPLSAYADRGAYIYGEIVEIIDNYIVVKPFGRTDRLWVDVGSKKIVTVNGDEVTGAVSPDALNNEDIVFVFYTSGGINMVVNYHK